MKRAILLCVFAIFVVLVVGSSYLVGRETGQWKGWDEGYWRGMHDQYEGWKVLTTKTLKDKLVFFTDGSEQGGIRWHAMSNEGVLWMADDLKKKGITPIQMPSKNFMSGVTSFKGEKP